MPHRLPPLTALRTFEVAARAGSFTAAAAELGVTHGAVSKQIQALETWLGQSLFVRSGQRMAPTPVNRRGISTPIDALHH
jgi:LysR family transcriptional regulator, glycine cleavage system transcriptional activator